LLAFVALGRGRIERPYAAGVLWPFVDDVRAAGNLRSALWRLRRAGIDVIIADKWSLTLAHHVVVDAQLIGEWASRLIHGMPLSGDLSLARLPADALDLLPGWHDDWAIIERERMRQRVLHGMEALSKHLARVGRYDDAVDVAVTAIAAEPLRESAQRVLLEALLSQGNWADADRAFTAFQALIRLELGVEPSPGLVAMMSAVDRGPCTLRSRGSAMAATQFADLHNVRAATEAGA
jgi:DNA-binding SARP family transcriptional activator